MSTEAERAQFTPGPWQRCGADRGCKCGHVWDATGNVHVATAEYAGNAARADLEGQEVYVQSLDEAKANARLIAAAPAMLGALKHCLGILCESGNLTNYRNLSDAELGKAWVETAKEAAAVLDQAEGRNV